ncbi:hypothetical protein IWW57_000964 [Coemansia sp. S610]|nr:hypothetical protein IWW57_000964 [Coemansia sp. S610]
MDPWAGGEGRRWVAAQCRGTGRSCGCSPWWRRSGRRWRRRWSMRGRLPDPFATATCRSGCARRPPMTRPLASVCRFPPPPPTRRRPSPAPAWHRLPSRARSSASPSMTATPTSARPCRPWDSGRRLWGGGAGR